MSNIQKVKKLSGKLYEDTISLNTLINSGEYNEALNVVSDIYSKLGDIEQKLYELCEQ